MTSIKILINILDDADSDREFIEKALSKNNQLQITSFYNPKKFRESLSDEVNLIITDVRVPGYDVFETIQYVHDNFSGICIIVVSAFFDDDIYAKLFELRTDRVVKKGDGMDWAKQVAVYVEQLLPQILYKDKLMKL